MQKPKKSHRRNFLELAWKASAGTSAFLILAACGAVEQPPLRFSGRKAPAGKDEPPSASESDAESTLQPAQPEPKPEAPNPQGSENKEKTSLHSLTGLSVFLDVGHGGSDSGAIAGGGTLKEIDFNGQQSLLIASILEKQGAKVQIGKYNTSTSLTARAANAANFQVFVSLHNNAADSKAAQGSETFTGVRRATQNDKKLAISIQNELAKIWTDRPRTIKGAPMNRGTKSNGLGVLESAKNSTGACCLTESFFVTEQGLTLAAAKTLAENAARRIAEGIALYWVSKNSGSALSLTEELIPDFPYDDSAHLNDH